MDGVHPCARECATDSATVQGHSEHSAVGVSRRYKQGVHVHHEAARSQEDVPQTVGVEEHN